MSIQSEEYFAVIPESVLYGDVSAQAVRLYGALSRHANREKRANPSRKRLANEIRVKSVDTVDRALKELVQLGAVEVQPEVDEAGDRTANSYYLKTRLRGRTDAATPPPTDAATGSRTDAAQTKEDLEPEVLEPKRARSLPSNFVPSPRLLEWAAKEHPKVDPQAQTARFCDYHRAKGSRFKDWDAAWRNWIRRSEEFGKVLPFGSKAYANDDEWTPAERGLV